MEQKIIGVKELSSMLGLCNSTVQQYASKRPSRLPPPISQPNATLKWRAVEVENWIKQRQAAWVQLELPFTEEAK